MEVYGSRLDVQTTDELVYDIPQPRFLKDSSRADSTLSQISGISYTDSSSGELVRILLAPYMSPFIVSLKKVKTWESLVQLLQRMFGESFCSVENPPHITNHHSGSIIEEEQWKKVLKPDLTIVVHTSKKSNNNSKNDDKDDDEMLHRKSASSASKGHSKSPSCELLSTGGTVVAIGMETQNHSQKQKGIKRERSFQNLLASYRMPKHGKSASDGHPPQPMLPAASGGEGYSNSDYVQAPRPPLKSVFESYNEKDGKPKTKMGKKIWGAMVSVFKDHSEHDHSHSHANTSVSSNPRGSQDQSQPDSEQGMHVANLERARPKKRKDSRSKRNSKIIAASAAKRNSRRMELQTGQTVVVTSSKERKNKDLLGMRRKKRRSHQMSPTLKRASLERTSTRDTIDAALSSPSDAYSPTSTAVEELRSFTKESPKEYSPSKVLPPTPVSPTLETPFSPPPTRAPPPPPPPPVLVDHEPQQPVDPRMPSPPPSPVETVRPLTIHREKDAGVRTTVAPVPPHAREETPAPVIVPVEKKHRRTLSKGSITSIRPRLSLRTSANSLKEMAARHLRSDSKSRSNSAVSPPVPTRPKESVGLNPQYDCLDEEVIRKTVEDLMNGIKKSMEEEPETPVEPSTPSKERSGTPKSKSGKSSKTRESPRRKRRGTTSSSADNTARPDSRSSRRTTRSRAESVSGNSNRHSNMPHDGKPLPKLPYKFSPFPAPTPTTPTFYATPAPSTTNVSIKNGHLPHIAPFEELVRNTRSYSDAATRDGGRPSTAGRNGSISSASGHRVNLQRHGSNASATTATTAMTAATVSER